MGRLFHSRAYGAIRCAIAPYGGFIRAALAQPLRSNNILPSKDILCVSWQPNPLDAHSRTIGNRLSQSSDEDSFDFTYMTFVRYHEDRKIFLMVVVFGIGVKGVIAYSPP